MDRLGISELLGFWIDANIPYLHSSLLASRDHLVFVELHSVYVFFNVRSQLQIVTVTLQPLVLQLELILKSSLREL